MGKHRKVLAFVVGPLVGALCVVVPEMLLNPLWARKVVEPAVVLVLLWAFGIIVSVVLGLPLLLLLRRLNRLGHVAFTLAGVLVGILVYLFIGLAAAFMSIGWAIQACVFPALVATLAFKAVGGWSSNPPPDRTPPVGPLQG